MHRRTVLGTLAAGFGTLIAGCSRSRVDGVVVSNETSLVFSHEYSTQATYSGTRIVVDVAAENEGSEPITPDGQVPRVVCTFLDNGGETLHRSGLELKKFIGVEETTTLEFTLAINVDDVSSYELRSEWVEE